MQLVDRQTACHFNSHAHVERDCYQQPSEKLGLYFNSHAHVERDQYFFIRYVIFVISTHTLTWSVTYSLLCLDITIHHFNSHAHVERDMAIANTLKSTLISTHTLTWSVTYSIDYIAIV